MDGEDQVRILLDILWESFRKTAAHNAPENSVKWWLETELLADDVIYAALERALIDTDTQGF